MASSELIFLFVYHWGQGVKYPVGTCWIHCDHSQQVITMCPVGEIWIHSECAWPCESNVPSGHILIVITMYPSMWSQCTHQCDHNVPINVISMYPLGTFWLWSECAQWGHFDCNHNVPINVFTMCPAHYIMVSFTMLSTMCPACGWATHSKFFHKVSSDVSRMCTAIHIVISLKVHGEIEQYWDYIVITSKRTPWGHYGHITG